MSSSKRRWSSTYLSSFMRSISPVHRALAGLCMMTLIASLLVACNAQSIAGYLESSDLFNTVVPIKQPRAHKGADEALSSEQPKGSAQLEGDQATSTANQNPTAQSDQSLGQTDKQTTAQPEAEAEQTHGSSTSSPDSSAPRSPASTTPSSADSSGQTDDSNQMTVHVVIECSKAVNAGWTGQAIIFDGTIHVEQGMSVLDVTKQLAAVSVVNSQYGAYVRAIDSLAEKQYGTQSGWVYQVNGVAPNYSADKYQLNNHDSVRWSYVTGPR